MAAAPTPPLTVEAFTKNGGLLHKFSVVDDQGNTNEIGAFLDDGQGPPPSTILNHLICRNEYDKNLPLVTQLDSFALLAYSKEKEYKHIVQFTGYLQGRKKAAKVLLDKTGTVGYLYPGPGAADGVPCLRCYYESGRARPKKRPAPTPGAAEGSGGAAFPLAPPTPTGAAAKRVRGPLGKGAFQYVPPDPLPTQGASPPTTKASASTAEKEDGPVYEPGGDKRNGVSSEPAPPLPDPSQFPRSKDPRFTYVPPTPTEGVEPPPFYDDPESCPVIEGLTLSPDMAALAATAAAGVKAVTLGGPGSGSVQASSPRAGDGGGGAWGKDQKVAEGFYNNLRREKGTRNQSLVFHMRKLNNWVKAQLINSLRPADAMAGRDLEVLDLACGKGGDFTKWREVSRRYPIARYVGVDIAKASLVDAIGRYHQDKHIRAALGSTLTLGCADLGATDLANDDLEVWEATEDAWSSRPLLDEEDQFDAVTMQFALHYMFEDERRARHFLSLVARHLRPGGSFIATTVDARVVVEMLAGLGQQDAVSKEWVARLVDEEKRELCRLQVDDATYRQLFQAQGVGGRKEEEEEEETPCCGLRYKFLLRDGSEDDGAADAVNAPEWMIPLPFLRAAAREYGLELERALNFHELVNENRHQINSGHGGIRWTNSQGSISPTEWDIARIYIALKFTRVA